MTKKYKREDDIVERLEIENRELKALVRTLQKRLKKIDKDFIIELEEAKKEKHVREDSQGMFKVLCQECGKGEILETNLLGRIFFKCSVCDYKGRKK